MSPDKQYKRLAVVGLLSVFCYTRQWLTFRFIFVWKMLISGQQGNLIPTIFLAQAKRLQFAKNGYSVTNKTFNNV